MFEGFLGYENFTTEMVAVCVLISIVAAFAYVYRKRVKNEYKNGLLGKDTAIAKEKPKKQINPQGSKNDYLQMLSAIVTLARKKKWLLIAPAVIEVDGVYTQMIALIVTPEKIIGICAFGHGGTIVAASGKQDWTQRVNGVENKIASPIPTLENARAVMQKTMKKLGIEGRTLEIMAGFTHPHATLQGAAAEIGRTMFDLQVCLQMEPAAKEENESSKEIVEKLRTVVLKPEKSSKAAQKSK